MNPVIVVMAALMLGNAVEQAQKRGYLRLPKRKHPAPAPLPSWAIDRGHDLLLRDEAQERAMCELDAAGEPEAARLLDWH